MKTEKKNEKEFLQSSPLSKSTLSNFLARRSPFGGLSVRATLILGTLVSGFILITSLLGFFFFCHSYWLLWFSTASFATVCWTVWIEFAPRTLKERLECRPFKGIRFNGAFGAGFNLILLFLGVWYLKGSLPYAPEDQTIVIALLISMALFYPLTVWASGKRTYPKG